MSYIRWRIVIAIQQQRHKALRKILMPAKHPDFIFQLLVLTLDSWALFKV